jgi:glycosyltransferase involved in cell wall biosynthesis
VVLFLPAHDEEATVASVVGRVPERVGGHPVRCLVVDDGSGDRTAELAEEAGALVLGSAGNQGLGAAVRRGLQAATGCGAVAVAFCDADAEILHDYNYAQVLTLDLLAKGYRYLEVPIGYSFRSAGRSFVRPASYLRRVLPAVWRELNGPAGQRPPG